MNFLETKICSCSMKKIWKKDHLEKTPFSSTLSPLRHGFTTVNDRKALLNTHLVTALSQNGRWGEKPNARELSQTDLKK